MVKLKYNNHGNWLYISIGFVLGVVFFLGISFFGYKLFKNRHHISRYAKVDPLMQPKKGFNVFVASSLEKVFKDGKTLVKPHFSQQADLSSARNEYESFQIVVSNSSNELKNITMNVSDLVDENSVSKNKVAKENITVRTVGYVPTKKPYYRVKFVGDWPDPLIPYKPINVKPNQVQPFWITIYVPENTSPGLYRGKVAVTTENVSREIPIELEVYEFALPKESHLKTAFDFYGHILDVRYPGKSKEEYAQLSDQYIINMLKHRMNPVLNLDPTSPTEMAHVDRYRTLGLSNFSVGKKGGTFGNNWPEDDQKLEELLPLYRTYGETLALNNLIDSQYIYTWDEGEIGNPQVSKVASMIHRAYAKIKNMVCYHGIWDPKDNPAWGKDIDIWCFQISNFVQGPLDALKKTGMEIWMYVSGPSDDGTPNLAIDFDSMDYRIIPWMAWKYEIKGFLYWCVNWWTIVDPFESAANTKWQQNGNGLLFYPGPKGPIDSIRSEVFRDGMEDYEYFIMLQEKMDEFKKSGLDQTQLSLFKQAENLLNVNERLVQSMFNFSKDQTILLKQRKEMAGIISKMNTLLESISHAR